ncbi:MAG: hypothetical protein BWZ02_03296 [Lentisphaerae bacterium ADurb.BinA184]|nr:MAG: hypothetical protein BWZ02_03296 [Lentisphaerae bacterium ADurb.BinA184]
MSATLVIADIHHDFAQAEAWIEQLAGRFQSVVFTGDYFDSHGTNDTPEDLAATAAWLEHSLGRPERIHLVGNYDLSYLFPGKFTACSGFTDEKQAALAPFLRDPVFQRLRPAVEVDGWLLTHAGVHRQLCKDLRPAQVLPAIQAQWAELQAGGQPPLFACGYTRGGDRPYGGITWQDFDEARPTPGLHQIFAHTPAATVRVHWVIPDRRLDRVPGEVVARSQTTGINVCADTELRSVLLIEDGALTLFASTLPGGAQLIVGS